MTDQWRGGKGSRVDVHILLVVGHLFSKEEGKPGEEKTQVRECPGAEREMAV
jgi:hypothetical protein